MYRIIEEYFSLTKWNGKETVVEPTTSNHTLSQFYRWLQFYTYEAKEVCVLCYVSDFVHATALLSEDESRSTMSSSDIDVDELVADHDLESLWQGASGELEWDYAD